MILQSSINILYRGSKLDDVAFFRLAYALSHTAAAFVPLQEDSSLLASLSHPSGMELRSRHGINVRNQARHVGLVDFGIVVTSLNKSQFVGPFVALLRDRSSVFCAQALAMGR